ncbi:uncharacterized protein LOC141670534 [Apium graveolens]|uniref:uncharacterized protein LOC141670534 n=1 Tax=Apium graveolens TaxID=4045 RepID=UPI003D7B0E8D
MLHRTRIIFFWLSLLFTVICCHNKDEKLQVVGFIEHRDFAGSKVKVSQTFSGLHVTIGCRSTDGKIRTMGSSEIDEEEKFRVFLPQETVKDGVINKDCYAQVHSASDSSCPLSHSQNPSNINFRYKSKHKNTISHSQVLNFSPITCTSKFLWPFHKPKWLPILPPQIEYRPPRPTILTPKSTLSPSFSPSSQPISTFSPPLPQPEDVPPAFSPAYDAPLPDSDTPVPVSTHLSPFPSPKHLPHKNYPPAFSSPPIPKSKQPSSPKLKDLSSAPAPSYYTPATPLPDESLPPGSSPPHNLGFSPAPTPNFDTPASTPPEEALPSRLSPPPLANNNIPFPPHVPSFRIPQPPPIPTVNRPSPPAL